MKNWKLLLVAISIAVLPFALVAVGQAQQMTCWGLRPAQIKNIEGTDNSVLGLCQPEGSSGNADATWQHEETSDKVENIVYV
jgi:hypothetical protein